LIREIFVNKNIVVIFLKSEKINEVNEMRYKIYVCKKADDWEVKYRLVNVVSSKKEVREIRRILRRNGERFVKVERCVGKRVTIEGGYKECWFDSSKKRRWY